MSDMRRIFDRIDALFETYESLWERICAFETPSDNKAALDAQTRFIADFAESRGLRATETPFPKAGNCLTVETCAGERPQIALLAHLDTVHPVGAFGDPPVRRAGDILTGPGVIDCKGGACVALMTAEALMRAADPVPAVRVILTTDEEVGAFYSGEAGPAYIRDQARGAVAAFNCETGVEGALTVGRKGVLHLRVDVRGKAGHAGNDYFTAVSAVKEAAHKILAIEALSRPEGATFNCGVVSGGTKANVVPEECRFDVDVRAWTPAALDRAMEQVGEIVARAYIPGSAAEMRVVSCHSPMQHLPANDRLFEKVLAASRRYGLEEGRPIKRGGGSDSSYTVEAGVPTICSFGPTGTGGHTLQENGWIPSLRTRAMLLAASIVEALAEDPGDCPDECEA